MKTDSFFYRFFLAFPEAFFLLIGLAKRKAKGYKFTSVEVKDIDFRFDGLFVPKAKSGRLQRVYLTDLPGEILEKFPLNLLKIIIDSKKKVLATAEKIIRKLPEQVPNETQQEVIVELLINLLVSKLPKISRREIEKMFEPLLSDVKKSRFYQELAQEEKRKIAKALLKKKMSFEFISEVTGLSAKQIRALTKDLAERKN